MSERLVIGGKFTDLTDPVQLGRLNDLLAQTLAIVNSFDQGSFALAWIEGAIAGMVIASKGVGNPPEWDASPTLTGATFSGLTASQLVVTSAAKALASLAVLTVALGGTGASTLTDNGVLYGNATSPVAATAEGATGTVLGGVTGNPPAFTPDPVVTSLTASGLTASQMVVTDGSKKLASQAPDSGWSGTAGYTADKAFDPETALLLEVARVLGTLVDTLKTKAILAA